MAEKGIPFPRPWYGGMISTNLEVIWAIYGYTIFRYTILETTGDAHARPDSRIRALRRNPATGLTDPGHELDQPAG
jgi:hypothetical protein